MVELQVGDQLLVKDGKSILSKAITLVMKRYKKKQDIEMFNTYHHTGTIVDLWGRLHVAEAIGKGFVIRKIYEAYTSKEWETRVHIKRPVKPYTEQEKRDISRNAVNYSVRRTPYDFLNFYYQLKLVFTNKWTGPTGVKAQGTFYCSEATATLANSIRTKDFPMPWKCNPMDIAAAKQFYFLSNNH